MTTPETTRATAERLAGGHYYCEDCWYSCPLAEDGCCDERQGTECNCGLEQRIVAIESALRAAQAAKLRELADETENTAFGLNGADVREWLRAQADQIEQGEG